ncbi:hypothetical protein SDC9_127873 [bioreactor metagenome]|uniref:Uncharacterized protein n=1 Tax=bioreactor metagenome TaxID=1076179 RepID=A0A645CVA8_9ZZZZ
MRRCSRSGIAHSYLAGMLFGVINKLLKGLIRRVLAYDEQIRIIFNARKGDKLIGGNLRVAQYIVENQITIENAERISVRIGVGELRGSHQTRSAGHVRNHKILGNNTVRNCIQDTPYAQVRGASRSVRYDDGNIFGGIIQFLFGGTCYRSG